MAIRKLNKNDYSIGQTVALRYDGNASRGKEHGAYALGAVTKIGSKILYINDNIKISMDTGYEHSNYSSNYRLYDSEEHLIESLKGEKLIELIRRKIGQYGASNIEYDKLKEIARVLDIEV